jgi:hypothetical protein
LTETSVRQTEQDLLLDGEVAAGRKRSAAVFQQIDNILTASLDRTDLGLQQTEFEAPCRVSAKQVFALRGCRLLGEVEVASQQVGVSQFKLSRRIGRFWRPASAEPEKS